MKLSDCNNGNKIGKVNGWIDDKEETKYNQPYGIWLKVQYQPQLLLLLWLLIRYVHFSIQTVIVILWHSIKNGIEIEMYSFLLVENIDQTSD